MTNEARPLAGAVKPLEWTWHKPPSVWRTKTVVGVYEVDTRGDWVLCHTDVRGRVNSGGKAAAQADYAARILSALEAPTPPADVAGPLTGAIWHFMGAGTAENFGPWVRAADYAALSARVAELEAENVRLAGFIDKYRRHAQTSIERAEAAEAALAGARVIAAAYEELLATVHGKCPSLLNEDSGASQVLLDAVIEANAEIRAMKGKP